MKANPKALLGPHVVEFFQIVGNVRNLSTQGQITVVFGNKTQPCSQNKGTEIMSTKNRVAMLLAASALFLVFAATTSARAADRATTGIWIGSWHNSRGESSLNSTIDFRQGKWDKLPIVELKKEFDGGAQPYYAWKHFVSTADRSYTYVVTAIYDDLAEVLDIQYAVFDDSAPTRPIYTGSGQFFRP